MNIQIFGSKKNADTRKAQRFFKERGIKVQFVDLKQKGLSKGELTSICQAVGGLDKLLDEQTKDQQTLTLLKYLVPEQKFAKVLDQQQVLKQPIIRNGRQAAVGYAPEVWQAWIKADWIFPGKYPVSHSQSDRSITMQKARRFRVIGSVLLFWIYGFCIVDGLVIV